MDIKESLESIAFSLQIISALLFWIMVMATLRDFSGSKKIADAIEELRRVIKKGGDNGR